MIELDEALAEVRKTAQRFRSSGLRSAQKIIEQLPDSAITAVMPIGMLGRSLTGYRVTGLDDKERSAELSPRPSAVTRTCLPPSSAVIVSLEYWPGTQRAVMGLSATAFFPPSGPRARLRAGPLVDDRRAGPLHPRRKRRVEYGKGHALFGEPIKVSGLHPSRKRDALIELGDQLYDRYISGELEKAAVNDPDRAHVLVVANSYDQCAWLARGISQSGYYRSGLCVAVRAEDRHSLNTRPAPGKPRRSADRGRVRDLPGPGQHPGRAAVADLAWPQHRQRASAPQCALSTCVWRPLHCSTSRRNVRQHQTRLAYRALPAGGSSRSHRRAFRRP